VNRSQRWSSGAAVIVVLALIAGWALLISPQRAHASKLRSQADSQEQANLDLQTQIKTRTVQAKGVIAQQARIAAIQQQLPATVNLASYVRLLTSAAAASHVDLKSIAPSTPTPVTLAQLTATAAAAPTAPTASASPAATTPTVPTSTGAATTSALTGVPIQLQISGGYFEIEQFLAKLQALPRATDVTSLALTPGGAAAPAGSGTSTAAAVPPWQVLDASVSLEIFMTAAPLPAMATATSSPSPSH